MQPSDCKQKKDGRMNSIFGINLIFTLNAINYISVKKMYFSIMEKKWIIKNLLNYYFPM